VFELYGTTTSILEIEYFEEVGTGLGPTLEFYAIASKEFGRRDLHLWRDADSSGTGDYVHRPQGFFPSAAASDDFVFVGTTRTKFFRILGQFVAKALLDSRIIDMAFNPIFMKVIQGDEVVPSIQALRVSSPLPHLLLAACD
jgi:E3 ubiquitin-protein ligase TRIP12